MTALPPIVFASRVLQFPAVTGAQLRTQRLLTGLSKEFAVSIVTFAHHPGTDEGLTSEREVRAAFPEADVVTVRGLSARKRVLQMRSAFGRHSWSHGRYRTRRFRAALAAEVARTGSRLIHFDDAGTALNGPVAGAINVIAPHNVEARVVGEVAAREDGLRKVFAEIDHRKLRREEPALWGRMDACVAISDVEADIMSAAGARRVLLAPNGTDPVAQLPLAPRGEGEPAHLLFVGTGSFQPNEHGLAWFVDEVIPHLRSCDLPFVVDVVGTPPREPRSAPEVIYHGRAAQLEPHYARAHVAIVPVHYGGGSRLKTIEAMAFGVPVVATQIGAEGLPILPDRHYLEANDPEGFANAIVRLASRRNGDHRDELERLVVAARAAAETLFWSRITAQLCADYRQLLELAGSSGAARRRSERQRRYSPGDRGARWSRWARM